MKNTFSKIRKLMMKNIKYTSLIYLNNAYCMNNNELNKTYCMEKNKSNNTYCIQNNKLNNTYDMKEKNFNSNNNLNNAYVVDNNNSNFIQNNKGCIDNNNPQLLYFGNNINSNFIQPNISYLNNNNIQHSYLVYNANPNFIQQDISYLNNNNLQHSYLVYNANPNFIQQDINYNRIFGNNANSNFIQNNRCYNINSIFTPYYANNNTNINNTNLNNTNLSNNAQTKKNKVIKNKIIINENEEKEKVLQKEQRNEVILQKEHRNDEKEKVFLTKKRGRLKKKDKKYCSEDFRKENLIKRIFSASVRLIQAKANKLLKGTDLKNMNFTQIYTFNIVNNKYGCIKELFKENIEDILKRNSDKCTNKQNNEDIIDAIKQSDYKNDENLSSLKEFLEKNNEEFFKEIINVDTLKKYDNRFKDFYEIYKNDDKHREIIKDYTKNFVEKVRSIKTRNKKKEKNNNLMFKTTEI